MKDDEPAAYSTYAVDKHIIDRDEADAACHAVLDLLAGRLTSATIDAYTDFEDAMTPDVRRARDDLLALGKAQKRRDPGIGVELELVDSAALELLRVFAPWSILVELWDEHSSIGSFNDCGSSIVVELTDEEAAELADRLSSIGPVVPLTVVRSRRRAARAATRSARIRRWRNSVLRD